MKEIRPWLKAMRLRTLPLSVSGIVIGTCFALYNGRFSWWVLVLAILTTISLQILSNLANDYGDSENGADNEDRVGPRRAVQSGEISPEEMLDAIKFNIVVVIILTLSLIIAAFGFTNYQFLLLFVFLGGISVYAALNYTMGDSPYGYKALGDIFVFVFFGLVSTIGSYLLYTHTIDHVIILPAIALGLLSVGVLNLNNMRDLEADSKAGKITIAVKLGKIKSKYYHYFLIGGAMVLSVVFLVLYYVEVYNFLFILAFIPLLMHISKIKKAVTSTDFDGQLKVLALSTFLYALLMGIGYILY
jgi:1,4-dihydroxy-2-naphthoate octaprenyltransferase